MVGGKDVLINTARSDNEMPNIVCVDLGGPFGPKIHFVLADGGKGTKIRLESYCSFGGILGFIFGGLESLPSLGKTNLCGFIV